MLGSVVQVHLSPPNKTVIAGSPCDYPDEFVIITSLGLVAQLVEQRTENPCVGGSIPPRATRI